MNLDPRTLGDQNTNTLIQLTGAKMATESTAVVYDLHRA